MASTLEGVVQQRLSSFKQSSCPSKEEVSYLLDVVPYLVEYYNKDDENVATDDRPESTHKRLDRLIGQSQSKPTARGTIFRTYMANVEDDYQSRMRITQMEWSRAKLSENTCSNCRGDNFRMDGSFKVCTDCGLSVFEQDMTIQGLTFDQQIHDMQPAYSYRRQNHFKEHLSKMQARQFVNIPDRVWDSLKIELKKHKITNSTDITQQRIRSFLQKLKLAKYYDHTAFITWKLSGIRPPQVPPKLERKLYAMFDEMQAPFERYKPPDRQNFLGYPYIFYKLFELLGEDQYLDNLKLLKNKQKLRDHDVVWKKICTVCDWEFLASV